MIYDPHAVQILTDGSCYKNPGGLSGCAALVVYPDDSRPEEQIVDIGVAESNISRMELMACNRALGWETVQIRYARIVAPCAHCCELAADLHWKGIRQTLGRGRRFEFAGV